MSFPITPGTLADGQLPSAVGTLYTATGPVARVQVLLGNLDTTARYVGISVKRSGGSTKYIAGGYLDAKEASGYVGGQLSVEIGALSTGDIVQGVADTPAVVNYVVAGVA